jgi:nicotinamidase-related amidase
MGKILVVVDLQKEFVKDSHGKKVYKEAVNYVYRNQENYSSIIALMYINDKRVNENMERLLDWKECQTVQSLEFPFTYLQYHSGYSIKEYPWINKDDVVDIIGFDTDACVLNACFDIFNIGCDMNILTEYIWSSGGWKMHDCGIAIMKRQFGCAVIK